MLGGAVLSGLIQTTGFSAAAGVIAIGGVVVFGVGTYLGAERGLRQAREGASVTVTPSTFRSPEGTSAYGLSLQLGF